MIGIDVYDAIVAAGFGVALNVGMAASAIYFRQRIRSGSSDGRRADPAGSRLDEWMGSTGRVSNTL
jgi:hypothetical protein